MATTASVGKLRAELTLKNKKFNAGMKKSAKRTSDLSNSLKKMGGTLVAVFGVAAIGRFISNTLSMTDSIGKFADRIGITTTALQEYRFAFDIAGVEQKKLDKGLLEIGKRLAQARVGTGSMVTILGRLDKQLFETLKATKNNNEALEVMFEALGNAKDQATKLALADAAFGGPGLKMTSAFVKGTAAFKATIAEGRRLNLFLSDRLVRTAEKVNDEFNIASRAIGINFKRAFLNVAPVLSSFARFMAEQMPKALRATRSAVAALAVSFAFINVLVSDFLKDRTLARIKKLQEIGKLFTDRGEIVPKDQLDELTKLTFELEEQNKQIEKQKDLFILLTKERENFIQEGLGEFPAATIAPGFGLDTAAGATDKLPKGIPTLNLDNQFGNAARSPAFLKMKEILEGIKQPLKELKEDLVLTFKLFEQGKITATEFFQKRAELAVEGGLNLEQVFGVSQEAQRNIDILNDSIERQRLLVIEMNDPLILFRQHYMDLNKLWLDGKINQDQLTESLKNLKTETGLFLSTQSEGLAVVREMTIGSTDAITDMFESIIDQEADFKDTFISVLKEIRHELINTFLTKNIAQSVFGFFTDLFAPGGLGPLRVPARRHGGPVGAGGAFQVGERGPEIFTPGVSGRITPNEKLGGNTIYIDARNSMGEADLERKMRRTIAEATPFLTGVAVKTVREDKRHNPNLR